MRRNFYWIWFLGAGVWFFDAILALHKHALSVGAANAMVAALFLAIGMFFRRQLRR